MPGNPLTDPDWAPDLADTVERVVGTVREKTTDNVVKIARLIVFGLLVIAGCAGAFFAPPFTGLDTLPALGVVLISLGVLLEDIVVVVLGLVVLVAGVALEIVVGSAAIKGIGKLF